jgi:hypothetical protein
MIANQIDDNTFEILIYDWVDSHDDYVCGHVKIDRTVSDGGDSGYWMFYPIGVSKPINAGDMRKISDFTARLNINNRSGELVRCLILKN